VAVAEASAAGSGGENRVSLSRCVGEVVVMVMAMTLTVRVVLAGYCLRGGRRRRGLVAAVAY
jgi:hypothetical protein